MTAIRLSICIATLNRAAFIGGTLDSIISQANDEVEIVVVDGASTDNTEEVVCQYRERFARLNYVRLPAKGGVDRDYDRTVGYAQGEYCWLMSDDDILKPGAIEAVLEAARAGYALIVVNAEVRKADLSALTVPGLLPTLSDRVYTPAEFERFFTDTGTYLSFIGCVVIRRAIWLSREREDFFGTEFIHIGVIFQSPLPGEVLVIARPWIAIRSGNASWSSRYFEIWMFKWPNLIWSLPGFPEAAKRQVCPREPWRMRKVLLISRAKGAFSLAQYHKLLEARLAPGPERLMARTIAALPGCLVNPPVFAYFSLFRREERYGLSEFRDSPFYPTNCLRRLVRRAAAVFRPGLRST